MNAQEPASELGFGRSLREFPLPAKALATMIIVMLSFGFIFAGGQVMVHDVVPTLFEKAPRTMEKSISPSSSSNSHGDLFSAAPVKKSTKPFYKTKTFIFALKFSHIHSFSMSLLFFFMGSIVCFLDIRTKWRVWLIVLPFVGIIIDLSAVWLKLYVSPAFFWLHIPGGLMFSFIFLIDAGLGLWQMWGDAPKKKGQYHEKQIRFDQNLSDCRIDKCFYFAALRQYPWEVRPAYGPS